MQYSLRGRRRAISGALALVLAHGAACAAEVPADGFSSAPVAFAIAPQPLATALLAWGKQANVQVLTASGSIASWRSGGAQGVLTPNAALDELLQGTDLERESYDARTVVVRQRQKPGNATPAPGDPAAPFDPADVVPLATVDVQGLVQDGGFKADTTRSVTRNDAHLTDVPQSISVVTRDVIESQQAVDIGDVARYVAGVQYVDGYGGAPLFLIRGFDAGHGMTDGMPNGIARTEDLPPLIGIERVEVLRGPEAILGDASQNNNFGGSVNVVMKRPQAETVRTLTYSLGKYDGGRLGIDLAGTASKDGSVTYRLVAAGQRGEKTDEGDGGGHGAYIAPSLAWQGERTRVMGGLEFVDNRVPGPEHTVLLGASLASASPYRSVPGTPGDTSTYRTGRAVFELDHEFEDWTFHSQGQYVRQRSDGNSWSYVSSGFGTQSNVLSAVARSFRYTGTYWTWQNDLTRTFRYGDVTHTVLVGVDLARTHAGDGGSGTTTETESGTDDVTDRDAYVTTRPLAYDLRTGATMSAKYNALIAPVSTTVQTLGGSWQTNAGVYLQDQVAIGDDWNVLAALRRTTYKLETHWTDGSPRTIRKARWIPKLGVVYKLTPGIALYADSSTGFQPDPLLGKDGQPLPVATSRQVELGGKFDLFDHRARLTAAVYRIHVDHSVDLVSPEPPFFATPGPGQTNRGVELEFSGRVAEGLDVLASVTEARIHNNDDTRPTGSPRHQAAAWASYRFGDGDTKPWGVGAGILARSRSIGRTSGDGQYFGIPGQASVETNVSRYGRNWRLTLGVKNLFARTLYAVNFDETFVPIRQGRVVLLSGSYDF
ncbi:MAG: TonB-dependent receptor [Luteibacter sp.]|uniref:TonB-dependent siderophore receptor n=1 Tax=unclassified Luteibacter TaxID=2620188 RepID=UPI002809A478|nr:MULTISPECIES: TonB-dependent receptor [unclassified Luteibacter]MDQ7994219.1 TonB-dependent receptor [Luteibacter sp.]MDQ8048520.1 TonB-dependent receptor [Luteibacter sp.]MDR6642287.1 iron complex outermembrane receptor protein [Luteibacter sp. 1214]